MPKFIIAIGLIWFSALCYISWKDSAFEKKCNEAGGTFLSMQGRVCAQVKVIEL